MYLNHQCVRTLYDTAENGLLAALVAVNLDAIIGLTVVQ